MRLFVSVLLLAASTAGFAQIQITPSAPSAGTAHMEDLGLQAVPLSLPDQTGCPVALTSARLNWPGTYMPVTSAEKVMEPNLALGFQNSSGKAIRSVAITAELRVKKDVYALDATPVELQLSFAGTEDLNKELGQLAMIPLPKGLHEYGVVQVRLDQVLFADGMVWKAPVSANPCEVRSFGLISAK
jgi:hypothetical protein